MARNTKWVTVEDQLVPAPVKKIAEKKVVAPSQVLPKLTSPMQVAYEPSQIPYKFPVTSDAEAIEMLRSTASMHSGFLWAQVMIKVADYLEGKKK